MRVVKRIADVRAWRKEASPQSVGFVPTMGALHEGHLSLVREARRECDQVAVSIFVNPTQFAPGEDLQAYPRDPEGDRALLEAEAVDLIWFGRTEELYPSGFATRVSVPELARGLCGRTRPHHFGGVTLIVLKLLHIVGPSRAYFGRKDYQQLRVVQRMAADLDLDVEVVGCPSVREGSGLALSSRNQRLTDSGRRVAAILHKGLEVARAAFEAGERRGSALVLAGAREILSESQVTLEYLELVDASDLSPVSEVDGPALLAVAARVDGVRLIDNVVLERRGPTGP